MSSPALHVPALLFSLVLICESISTVAFQLTSFLTRSQITNHGLQRRFPVTKTRFGRQPDLIPGIWPSSSSGLFMIRRGSIGEEDADDQPTELDNNKIIIYAKVQLEELLISDLLVIVEEYKIRITPTASRDDLIDLIMQYQKNPIKSDSPRVVGSDGTGNEATEYQRRRNRESIPINGTNSATNSSKRRQRRRAFESPSIDDPAFQRRRTRRTRNTNPQSNAYAKRKQRRKRNNQASLWDETFEDLNSYVSIGTAREAKRLGLQAVDEVTNAARIATDRVGRRIGNWSKKRSVRHRYNRGQGRDVDDDVDGVQEVDWYYVSRDEELDRDSSEPSTPRPSPRPRRSPRTSRVGQEPRSNRYRPESRSASRDPLTGRSRPVRRKSSRDSNETGVNGRVAPRTREQIKKKRVVRRETTRGRNSSFNGEKKKELLALPPKLETVDYVPNLDQDPKTVRENDITPDEILYPDMSKDSQWDSECGDANEMFKGSKKKKEEQKSERKMVSSRQQRNPSNTTKKVYSAYPKDSEILDFEELYGSTAAGAIDSIGEFLADVAGGDYSRGATTRKRRSSANETTLGGHDKERLWKKRESRRERYPHSNRPKRRYWKDRLAERVDYALGVHEDGKYYRSWQQQLDRKKAEEVDGNDPVSIFYDTNQKVRRRKNNAPFWEQDGNLVSVLFGRTPSGKELTFNVRVPLIRFCSKVFVKALFRLTYFKPYPENVRTRYEC